MEQEILKELKANVLLLSKDADRAFLGLSRIYAERLNYESPIQRAEGRDAFFRLIRHMATNWAPFKMEIDEGVAEPGRIYGRFFMSFYPPFLGRPMNIEGVSRCVLDGGSIVEQRDYYDAVSSALDVVPLAGPTFRRIISMFKVK
jgi:hypothetical protein